MSTMPAPGGLGMSGNLSVSVCCFEFAYRPACDASLLLKCILVVELTWVYVGVSTRLKLTAAWIERLDRPDDDQKFKV